MGEEFEKRICGKIDRVGADVRNLNAEVIKNGKAVSTLVEKMKHPCAEHAQIDRRITTIEAKASGKGDLLTRLLVILALVIALAGTAIGALNS